MRRTPWIVALALTAAVLGGGCAREAPPSRDAAAQTDSAIRANASALRLLPPLAVLDWRQRARAGHPPDGTLVAAGPGEDFTAVRLENASERPRQFTLATIEAPAITEGVWGISGRVRCTAVEGKGYVEMLHRFPGGEVLFARTFAAGGPEQMLSGTQPWRDFALGFRALKPHRPERITVAVMLPRRGVVEIGPLTFYQGEAAALIESGAAR